MIKKKKAKSISEETSHKRLCANRGGESYRPRLKTNEGGTTHMINIRQTKIKDNLRIVKIVSVRATTTKAFLKVIFKMINEGGKYQLTI